ncbi:MAG: hypothetical protein PHR35_04110 [Kiritimatiellae bacterium]|nr:hypothetical protein [Kiritimatiellia bacterium]
MSVDFRYYVELETTRIIVSQLADRVSVETHAKPAGSAGWRLQSGVMLSSDQALDLATALLNMSGKSAMLPKRLRWRQS